MGISGIKYIHRGLSGSTVVKIPCFHYRTHGSIPDEELRSYMPPGQKKTKEKYIHSIVQPLPLSISRALHPPKPKLSTHRTISPHFRFSIPPSPQSHHRPPSPAVPSTLLPILLNALPRFHLVHPPFAARLDSGAALKLLPSTVGIQLLRSL